MSDPLEREAERIARLPRVQGRRELAAIFGSALEPDVPAVERDRRLTFNAHLATAVRELCERRKLSTPWSDAR